MGAFVSDTILHPTKVGSGHEVPPEKRVSKKPINGHAALADQVILVERLSEHLGYVLPQAAIVSGSESRGRANTSEMRALRTQSCLEPTNQTGQVGTLRPVESVEFVHDEPAEGSGLVKSPESLVAGTAQQVVQHLVVSKQDVRRPLEERAAIRHDIVLGHRDVRAAIRLANEHPGSDLVFQRRGAVDQFRDASRLIVR